MQVKIVLGLLFGDEGKGNTVNALCKKWASPLVVRFGGGSQCGHTVYHKQRRHVFSSFGSGTFEGTPTHISRYSVIDPVAFKNERELIKHLNPQVEIDAEAMIVLPHDKAHNRELSDDVTDTTGMGFGAAIERNENHFHIYMRDLHYQRILHAKIEAIKKEYYDFYVNQCAYAMSEFYRACDYLKDHTTTVSGLKGVDNTHDTLIFEGHQGIMLDQHYGIFPYVTRSNTTSKNIWKILRDSTIYFDKNPEIYYVMRSYLTRHGDGSMCTPLNLERREYPSPPYETNVLNEWQGEFRKDDHSEDLIRYALECDRFQHPIGPITKNLVITCLDQTNDHIFIDGKSIPFEDFKLDKLKGLNKIPFRSTEETL